MELKETEAYRKSKIIQGKSRKIPVKGGGDD